MELSKKQFKLLLDNINWEFGDRNLKQITNIELRIILEKSLINYEGERFD